MSCDHAAFDDSVADASGVVSKGLVNSGMLSTRSIRRFPALMDKHSVIISFRCLKPAECGSIFRASQNPASCCRG